MVNLSEYIPIWFEMVSELESQDPFFMISGQSEFQQSCTIQDEPQIEID